MSSSDPTGQHVLVVNDDWTVIQALQWILQNQWLHRQLCSGW